MGVFDLGLAPREADSIPSAAGKTIEEMEKEMILSTLESTKGSRKDTARMLGITTRTLSNKIKTYSLRGIEVPAKRSTA